MQTTRDFAARARHPVGLQRPRRCPTLGNTTGLAFPNSGIARRTQSAAPRVRPIRARRASEQPAPPSTSGATARRSAIGLALGSINGAFNLDVALCGARATRARAAILSTPRVDDAEQQSKRKSRRASRFRFRPSRTTPSRCTFKDAALMLKVTPQITAAEHRHHERIALENATPDFSRQVERHPADRHAARHDAACRSTTARRPSSAASS